MQVLLGTHKGVGNEVDVFFDSEEDIATVLLRESREVNVNAWHINRLMRTQFAIVHDNYGELVTIVFYHLHAEFAIIKKQLISFLNVIAYIFVRQADNIVYRILLWATQDGNFLARLVVDWGRGGGSAYFRAFCINEYAQMLGHLTNVFDYGSEAFGGSVSRTHTDNINTSLIELANKFYITTKVTY
jgi:hypothetical protein